MDKTLYNDSYFHYRDTIANLIGERIYKVFRHIADIAFQQCKNTNTIPQHVAHFQNALSFVSKWTPAETEQEMKMFIKESGLDDFQECVACLYLLQLRMLVDIKPGMKRHTITIDIMDAVHFLHLVYISCARLMWKQALLFGCTFPDSVSKTYQQRIKELLLEEIKRTIDGIIPIQTIQRALLEPYDDVREETRTELEPVSDHSSTFENPAVGAAAASSPSPFAAAADFSFSFPSPPAVSEETSNMYIPMSSSSNNAVPLPPPPRYTSPILALSSTT